MTPNLCHASWVKKNLLLSATLVALQHTHWRGLFAIEIQVVSGHPGPGGYPALLPVAQGHRSARGCATVTSVKEKTP